MSDVALCESGLTPFFMPLLGLFVANTDLRPVILSRDTTK
jgi:hypothetical protein